MTFKNMSENEFTECKICQNFATKPNSCDDGLIYQNKYWQIRHSSETNILGYCIIEPLRHFLDLSEANEIELAHYGKLLSSLMKAQKQITKCFRIYTFSLAEAVPHYHLHVIPRILDFPQEYVGRGIMAYPLEPTLSKFEIFETTEKLKKEIVTAL